VLIAVAKPEWHGGDNLIVRASSLHAKLRDASTAQNSDDRPEVRLLNKVGSAALVFASSNADQQSLMRNGSW